jgi:hypothetical protein
MKECFMALLRKVRLWYFLISGSCTILIHWILLTCHCLPCWEWKQGQKQLGTSQYLCVHSESHSGVLSDLLHQWRGARNPENGAPSATNNEPYFIHSLQENYMILYRYGVTLGSQTSLPMQCDLWDNIYMYTCRSPDFHSLTIHLKYTIPIAHTLKAHNTLNERIITIAQCRIIKFCIVTIL